MNRIDRLFKTKNKKVLSIYFTAGFPIANSVEKIILLLEKTGADMIEIGMPYSDPLADGPVIQETSKIAISNGMTIENLFDQLQNIREKTSIPLLLMGYINPIMQFGFNRFCERASGCGIDGFIIPDLPYNEYKMNYSKTLTANDLKSIFLITPDTSEKRIRQIDELCSGFIYMVSSAAITGQTQIFDNNQLDYFKRIASMNLKNPTLVGFGIHNRETLTQVFNYSNGAIVGSAYMRTLQKNKNIEEATKNFFKSLS
jgi:tryptophan synthase alpha chain